jgi:hypothetical protein
LCNGAFLHFSVAKTEGAVAFPEWVSRTTWATSRFPASLSQRPGEVEHFPGSPSHFRSALSQETDETVQAPSSAIPVTRFIKRYAGALSRFRSRWRESPVVRHQLPVARSMSTPAASARLAEDRSFLHDGEGEHRLASDTEGVLFTETLKNLLEDREASDQLVQVGYRCELKSARFRKTSIQTRQSACFEERSSARPALRPPSTHAAATGGRRRR